MAATKNYENDQLSHVDYRLRQVLKFLAVLAFLLLFILGFVMNFPLTRTIDSNLQKILSSNPRCPIHYKQINYHLFPPGAELSNIDIPSRCSSGQLKDLSIKSLDLSLGGISFSPLGIVFKGDLDLMSMPLEMKMVMGIAQQVVKISEQTINLDELIALTNTPYQVRGHAQLDALINLKNNFINTGDIRIQSQDLSLPSQKISGFDTPNLNLNEVDLVAAISSQGERFSISRLNIGNQQASLRMNGKGYLEPKKQFINLELEISPSQQLNTEFPLLESLLSAYNKKDGFYRLKINGNMSRPQITSF